MLNLIHLIIDSKEREDNIFQVAFKPWSSHRREFRRQVKVLQQKEEARNKRLLALTVQEFLQHRNWKRWLWQTNVPLWQTNVPSNVEKWKGLSAWREKCGPTAKYWNGQMQMERKKKSHRNKIFYLNSVKWTSTNSDFEEDMEKKRNK